MQTDGRGDTTAALVFNKAVPVEVHAPKLDVLDSVALLDPEKLSRGVHRIEIGTLRGAPCKSMAYAVVRDGMVVGIEAEGCDATDKNIPKEVAELFREALGKLDVPRPAKPEEVVVFLSKLRSGITIEVWGCFWICVFQWCFFCCTDVASGPGGKCWIETRKAALLA